jgi:hypothetical protein
MLADSPESACCSISSTIDGEAMIDFRCWFCNKRYFRPEAKIGERFLCSCEHTLKVPSRTGKSCRVKRPLDYVVEAAVYGGGGLLLGLGLGFLILSRIPFGRNYYLILACGISGFLLGTFGGEAGVNYVGSLIRDRENS